MTSKLADDVQGQGPNWVFLHGWGMNRQIWEPIRAQLSSHARVRVVDLPGFGDSPWQSEWHDFQHAGDAVQQHLEAVMDEPFYLLGWSMGGLFATELALRMPTQIKGLVLLASSPAFLARENWPGIRPDVLSAFQQQLKHDFAVTVQRFLAVQAMGSPAAKADVKLIKQLLAQAPIPNPQALAAGLTWLEQVDQRAQLKDLNCPTLRLYGRKDSLVPIAQIDALTPWLGSQTTTVVFEQSAHTPFLNEPQAFIDALVKFQR
ncbi:MAG: pimeloyl-ACP methyl ester esterase BioH [Idiomarina sp.]|nr:pimeloyl-ACP methyl ester esterase BioH [Idiomarina sp.]